MKDSSNIGQPGGISRRDMLKAAGLAGLGSFSIGALAACTPSDGTKEGTASSGDVTWDK